VKKDKISKSPERGSFQKSKYIQRRLEAKEPISEEYLNWFDLFDKQKESNESDPNWQKNNLEYDLRSTLWILNKVRSSETYSQHLYAALCNNNFQKLEVIPILKEETWSCSWRYAGGIIADMREEGDYINWYCSGMNDDADSSNYVAESVVTEEIKEDLKKLGWIVLENND
jgi:hypothetical protein